MQITVASWNIEKNGQSSPMHKQQKVSDFVDVCCRRYTSTVVFLCEVHSARIDDYVNHAQSVYGNDYEVGWLPGGHSNAYVLLVRKSAGRVDISHDMLRGLNRGALLLSFGDFFLLLAHFKSGQTGLTKDQVQQAASFLQGAGNGSGKWAIIGDMNWDYANANALALPQGAKWATCWQDMTHVKGGILDWCIGGSATNVAALDVNNLFAREVNDLTGPDHRPVLFGLEA